MKKLFILAVSAVLVANVSAQEFKKECKSGDKQLSKEERVEMDIKRLTNELLLSDEQAKKFAVTFRDYSKAKDELFKKGALEKFDPSKELTDSDLDAMAKKRIEGMREFANLQEKYYDIFRKDLSARQVEKVLRLNDSFGKPCCGGKCGGHEGHGPRGEGFQEGPRPNFDQRGPRPDDRGPRPDGRGPKDGKKAPKAKK